MFPDALGPAVEAAARVDPWLWWVTFLFLVALWWRSRPRPSHLVPRRCHRRPGWVPSAVFGCVLAWGCPWLIVHTPETPVAAVPLIVLGLLASLGLLAWAGEGLLRTRDPGADGDADPGPGAHGTTAIHPEANLEALCSDPVRLRAWINTEHPIGLETEDLLGTASAVARVRAGVLRGETVAVLGRFGAGKSSIVEQAFFGLQRRGHRRVLVEGWSLDPETAPAAVLALGLSALREDIDLLDLRGLPERYQAAARGAAPAALRCLFDGPAANPMAQLIRLNEALATAGLTLDFDVQDLDRSGGVSDADARFSGLQALLDRLRDRECERLNFVVSADGGVLDYARLCRRVVHAPSLPAAAARRLMSHTKAMLLEEALDRGLLLPDWDRDRLDAFRQSSTALDGGLVLGPAGGSGEAVEALCRLIGTPRMLKQTLHHTVQAWDHLAGEADLDFIVAAEGLRLVRPTLIESIDRHRGPDNEQNRQQILGDAAEGDTADRVDLQQVVGIFNPRDEKKRSPATQNPQRSEDYWRRIRTVDPQAARRLLDQEVLQALEQASLGRLETLMDLLAGEPGERLGVEVLLQRPALRRFRLDAATLVTCASGVNDRAVDLHHAAARLDPHALANRSLWHAHREVDGVRDVVDERITAMLLRAAAGSLRLATGCLRCWIYGETKPPDPGLNVEATNGSDRKKAAVDHFAEGLRHQLGGHPERLEAAIAVERRASWSVLADLVLLRGLALGHADTPQRWGWLLEVLEAGLQKDSVPFAHLLADLGKVSQEEHFRSSRKQETKGSGDPAAPAIVESWILEDPRRTALFREALRVVDAAAARRPERREENRDAARRLRGYLEDPRPRDMSTGFEY